MRWPASPVTKRSSRWRHSRRDAVRRRRQNLIRILLARAARSFSYGALAVVLAQALASRGLSPVAIGAIITSALLTGAVSSASTGALVRRFGARGTFAISGIAMIVAAALLAGNTACVVVACLLGVVSPGGQDVGPFAAIEQVAPADEESPV